MTHHPLWKAFQIPHSLDISKEDISLPLEALPKQTMRGEIFPPGVAAPRCTIEYGKEIDQGGYGFIQHIVRDPAVGTPLCVKRPHDPEFSLCSEAILQWLSASALEKAGIHGAVPHVYDIFQCADETRYSMEFIDGHSALEAIATAANPDATCLQILAQAALLLAYLEETLRLDHRDLKADNIWVRPGAPVKYTLRAGGKLWQITAPFQVVILDFGFACLGGQGGNAILNLGDGQYPSMDPCPKEGRDLFQFLASLWSVDEVRQHLSPPLQAELRELLTYRGAHFADTASRHSHIEWIYDAVKSKSFRYPPLHPLALLQKLSISWKGEGTLKTLD